MDSMRVIITGATGMVGEGVLLECLDNPRVSEVLVVGRRSCQKENAKLKELLVPDFFSLERIADQLSGYDACFFCAGVSSVGMNEEKYRRLTYDTTMAFAKTASVMNPSMVFIYVSGASTDSTESSRMMWARVKGKTENDLQQLPFRAVYNFRPAVMLPYPGQENWKALYKWMAMVARPFMGSSILNMSTVGRAMINAVDKGYAKPVLEVKDIRILGTKS